MAAKSKSIIGYDPHYQVQEVIGKGAMGEVMLCHDEYLDRPLVIKRMQLSLLNSREMQERFQREVLVLSHLRHPNIVDIYGFWLREGQLHLSMEFVNGWTLRQLMDQVPRPPLWVTLVVLWEALVALEYAHADYAHRHIGPVIHRDIKPTNMMIGFNGRLKLLDFGISKPRQSSEITQPGTQIGTIAYMSPEQVHEDAVTPATDIFSMGVIALEMLGGKHPFRAANALQTCRNVLEQDPDWSRYFSGVPASLGLLLRQMLRKDPARRPTAQQALEALQPVLDGLPRDPCALMGNYILHVRHPEEVPPPPEPRLAARVTPGWLYALVGVLAGFVAGLVAARFG
ncbi:MAG TPA: protein kinase [Fibrobacteraceae bacterium]|nr:protein kinase [Fibrobacteraceae bacterium]